MLIEVFYTSVDSTAASLRLKETLKNYFPEYQVNFDLGDCDRIMRVVCDVGFINHEAIISILNAMGYSAGLLPDVVPKEVKTATR